LETKGLDYSDPSGEIVALGWSDTRGCWAVDWRRVDAESKEYLGERLRERRLTAFNAQFDGGWLMREYGWLPWEMCSYCLFMELAGERYTGQRWNLERLQTDVLGYPTTNKDDLTVALTEYKLTKDSMYLLIDLAPEMFLRYCALDAEAHLHGYQVLAETCVDMGDVGDVAQAYHLDDVMNEIELLAEQQLRGILIDVARLTVYRNQLEVDIARMKQEWFDRPDVAPHIKWFNETITELHRKSEPTQYTKSGKEAAAWRTWRDKLMTYQVTNFFNINSPEHLCWLFYVRMGLPVPKYTNEDDPDKPSQPATDKEALMALGSVGRALLPVKKKITEMNNYIDACLGVVRDGVLHPQLRSTGTVTGRLSGGQNED